MKRMIASAILGLGFTLVGSVALAPLPERLSQPGSVMVTYADGEPAHVYLAPDDRWRVSIEHDEVDPLYVEALLRFEDKRFWHHPGFDPIALSRAVVVNLQAGRVVTGASTLTMQLVRVLEPRPRTIRSKVIEIHRAMTLEMWLSKEEILSAYLSFAPYGRNLEGVQAASLSYFGHSSTSLSVDEIATLLAVPQNPTRRYPRVENEARLRAARDEIGAFLVAEKVIRPDQDAEVTINEIKASTVPSRLRPFPREIPHAADWLLAQYPNQPRIPSTLDAGTQRLALEAVSRVKSQREREGIYNTSIVVVDHQTDEVKALVGSFDYWDPDHGGQIVAFDNPRSPGSTLKPFIYAKSIDSGIALPEFLVPDIPMMYGTYAPRNYDGRFDGLVSYEESLSRSLNLPFVWGLQKVGVENFLGMLKEMGAANLSDEPGHYGLSVAAGGIELTPLELASLYSTLARGGVYRPLRWSAEQTEVNELRVFSEGASYLTAHTLKLKDRPDFPARWEYSSMPRDIAWKTGTSFGHRDAWAIGYGPRHTAVVWMGNVSNKSSSNLLGSASSGPVLFDVLESVADRTNRLEDAAPAPDDLIEVEVCSYSGRLVTEACPDSKQAKAAVSSVPTETCPYHRHVEVDLASGLAVQPGCRGDAETELRTVLEWPASIRRWLKDQHRHLPQSPSFAPACRAIGGIDGPEILSPVEGQVTLLIPGLSAEDQEIPLEADVPDGGSRISWFVNGTFLGSVNSDDRLWWTPTVGEHELLVVDARGVSGRRQFSVRQRGLSQAR